MASKEFALDIIRNRQSNQLSKATSILIIILVFIFPLFLGSGKYTTITSDKAKFFFIVMAAYLVAILLIRIYAMSKGARLNRPNDMLTNLNIADWALLAYLLFMLVSTIISSHPGVAFLGETERYDGMLSQSLYICLFFCVSRFYRPAMRETIAMLAGALIVCIIGILQYHGADIFSLFPYDDYVDHLGQSDFTGRNIPFRTTIGNINILAVYLGMTILIAAMLFVHRGGKAGHAIKGNKGNKGSDVRKGGELRDIKKRNALDVLCILTLGSGFYLISLTPSEAAIFGLLAAFIFSLPFVFECSRTLMRFSVIIIVCGLAGMLRMLSVLDGLLSILPWLIVIVIGLLFLLACLILIKKNKVTFIKKKLGIVVMVAVVLLSLAAPEFLGRNPENGMLFEAREILHGNVDESFGTGRLFIWKNSLEMVKERPLFGSGPDTFGYHFNAYYPGDRLEIEYDKAHNEYLQILVCNGILGLLAYLIFVFYSLFSGYKATLRRLDYYLEPLKKNEAKTGLEIGKNRVMQILLPAFIGSVIFYLAQAFFGIATPITSVPFFLTLGMLRRFSDLVATQIK